MMSNVLEWQILLHESANDPGKNWCLSDSYIIWVASRVPEVHERQFQTHLRLPDGQTFCIVECNMLLFSACDCIVML